MSGKPFTLLSDHNPLVYLRKQKDPRGKFARWIAELEEFEYNIEYIPGACNLKADSLSRLLSNTRNTEIPESDFEEKIYFVNTDRVIRTDQVRNEQDSDISIADVKQKIKHGENITTGRFKRVQKQLRIEDGILTRSGRHVIPASMRKFVTQTYHSIAHLSIDKLNPMIRKRFYWPHMTTYISNFIAMCKVCQQCKADNITPKAPLVPLFMPEKPMQFISIDIATLPQDKEGYKHILLVGDVFSKFIAALPMRNQHADTICEKLWKHWITSHGSPLYILSDQGSNVDGDTIRSLCTKFAIEKRRSSAYHSQGNGFAERNIRSIREILRTLLLDRKIPQNQWRRLLPEVTFAMNTTISSSTKCTPYNVVFGRNPILPEDIAFGVKSELLDAHTAEEYLSDIKTKLTDVIHDVRTHLQISQSKMKNMYDKKTTHKFSPYAMGDKVWLRKKCYKTGENRKLSPRRTGPWTVIETFPNLVNFRIKLGNIENVVHYNRLSPVKESPVTNTVDVTEANRTRNNDILINTDIPNEGTINRESSRIGLNSSSTDTSSGDNESVTDTDTENDIVTQEGIQPEKEDQHKYQERYPGTLSPKIYKGGVM